MNSMIGPCRSFGKILCLLSLFVILCGCACSAEPIERSSTPASLLPDASTMRPIRVRQGMTITVGQGRGDLQGSDDKVIQSAVDYVYRLGGGTVQILPGTYTLKNSVFMRSGVTLRGHGDDTILKKAACVTTQLVRDADWFEYAVQVKDPSGFTPGCGITLTSDDKSWPGYSLFTVTAIKGNVLYLDQRTEKAFWTERSATASTLFSVICGWKTDDVQVEDLVLDGNRAANGNMDGSFAADAFMQYCNRWSFKNVTARDFNGDGFSFQVCDDIHFDRCSAINNADLGFHTGSGAMRPVFLNCRATGNSEGIFWCWGSCDGLAEGCTLSDNKHYGIDIGHRDTDNVIRNCAIKRNGSAGIVFRAEDYQVQTPDRNTIENCDIQDNGGQDAGIGIDIQYKTKDITILNCRFENTKSGNQKTAVRIGHDVGKVVLEGNKISGNACKIEDLRPTGSK